MSTRRGHGFWNSRLQILALVCRSRILGGCIPFHRAVERRRQHWHFVSGVLDRVAGAAVRPALDDLSDLKSEM